MDKKPTPTEIADRARLLLDRPKPDPRTDVVKNVPPVRIPRPTVRQDTIVEAVPPPGPGNRRGPTPNLLSEPPTDPYATDWPIHEAPTHPESPKARRSYAELEADLAYERRRNAPIQPTPPRSISPPSGTRRVEWGLTSPTMEWLYRILTLVLGGSLVGGTVMVKSALDAPREAQQQVEAKAKQDTRLDTCETRIADEAQARYDYDTALAEWLAGVLPPLGVKVVTPPTLDPVKLLPTPAFDPHKLKGKQAPPVQPPPMPIPAKSEP